MKRNFLLLILLSLLLTGCNIDKDDVAKSLDSIVNEMETTAADNSSVVSSGIENLDINNLPEYEGYAGVEINNNEPFFTEEEKTRTDVFIGASELDELGRCGVCFANLHSSIMPTDERGDISSVTPSGWHSNSELADKGLPAFYQRCHLIGYQLSGINAEPRCLITGTSYLNVTGMLPYENKVASYLENTGNHVLFRVQPVYGSEEELVAKGVLMEAWSVEDNGKLRFCVYLFNVEPGIKISYKTGDVEADPNVVAYDKVEFGEQPEFEPKDETTYVINMSKNKFHKKDCDSVYQMSDRNRLETTDSREQLIEQGYSPCGSCNP